MELGDKDSRASLGKQAPTPSPVFLLSCLLCHKLDRAGGCHRRGSQLAAALFVGHKGIQIAEVLLTEAADVDPVK